MKTLSIKCPKCKYIPNQNDQWICDCGCVWNTFGTAGQCPRCKKNWEDTCCTNCHIWSKHLKFYPQLSDLFENEMKNINPKKTPKSNDINNES